MAYIGLIHAIHRSGGHAAHRPQHVARRIGSTIAVTVLREIDDDRIRGLRRDPCLQFWQGQTGYKFHCGCSCHGRRYPANQPLHFQVPYRQAANEKDAARRGLQAAGDVDRAAKIISTHDANSSGRNWNRLYGGVLNAVEHHTRARPKLFAVPNEEGERRLRHRNDHVDVARAVFFCQQRNKLSFPGLDRESIVERLGIQNNASRGFIGEVRTHCAVRH